MNSMAAVSHAVRQLGIRGASLKKRYNVVYRIQSPRAGLLGLKLMRVTPRYLQWMDRSLMQVRKNGFRRLGWRDPAALPTYSYRPKQGLAVYVLFPWISGRWPNIRSSADMRACGRTLARFHQAGRMPAPAYRFGNQLGSWPKKLALDKEYMIWILNRKKLLGVKAKAELFGYVKQARKRLSASGYYGLVRRPQGKGALCHGDGGPTNFIMSRQGPHLIDFDALRYDFPAYDLYRMIYNSCKDLGWKFSTARHILEGYESRSKLSMADYRMIGSLLRFPRATYHVLHSAQKRGDVPIIRKELSLALANERRVTSFLRQLDRYAQKKGRR